MQNESSPGESVGAAAPVVKVIGLGDAGARIVGALTGEEPLKLLACNTDAASTARLAASEKVVFGRKTTRGLGAGGDPDRGRAAAEEDQAKFSAACAGGSLVFVVAGLGGGTGTGAAPVVARVARQTGALVLAVVAMPFEFEGAHRRKIAGAGLDALKREADAVIVVPNERVRQLLDSAASLEAGFSTVNRIFADGVRAVARLLMSGGLIRLDLAALAGALRGRQSESALATAEASGPDRAQSVVGQLMNHPMLANGQALADADSVVVSLLGGPGFSFGDVNAVMRELNARITKGSLAFGAAIDPSFGDRLSVTIIAVAKGNSSVEDPERAEAFETTPRHPGRTIVPAPPGAHIETEFLNKPAGTPRSRRSHRTPPPELSPEQQQKILAQHSRAGSRRRRNPDLQQQLPLEIVSKGRFDKSEPTIHDGQDLDVPTFIRRGIVLN